MTPVSSVRFLYYTWYLGKSLGRSSSGPLYGGIIVGGTGLPDED